MTYSGMHPDTRLVTHRDCLDGMGAMLLFLIEGGSEGNIHPVVAPTDIVDRVVLRLLEEGTGPIHVVDVCPSAAVIDRLLATPGSVVCDHHASSVGRCRRDGCVHLMDRCGSLVYAEWLGAHCERDLVRTFHAIDAFDLNRTDRPEMLADGEWLADLLATMDSQEALALILSACGDEVFHEGEYRAVVGAVAKMRDQYAQEAVDRAYRDELYTVIAGQERRYSTVVAMAPKWWRQATGQALLRAHPDADIAVVVDVTCGTISLRSRPDGPDCSAVAARFGGGGHRGAAGFPIDRAQFLGRAFE